MHNRKGDIVELDDYRPHFCIPTDDGNVHVVPVLLVENWVHKRIDIADDPETKAVLRAIIKEWLEFKIDEKSTV